MYQAQRGRHPGCASLAGIGKRRRYIDAANTLYGEANSIAIHIPTLKGVRRIIVYLKAEPLKFAGDIADARLMRRRTGQTDRLIAIGHVKPALVDAKRT
jgi:hypothetical protein